MNKTLLSISGLILAAASSLTWAQVPTVCTTIPASSTPDITLAVASNFYDPAQAIVTDFQTTTAGTGKVIRVCHNSTGNLVTEIKTGSSGYNLFLAADDDAPAALKASNPGLVIGNEFRYTEGVPILWTNTTGVNISSGNVTNPTVASLALADPAKAPYGVAGQQILQNTSQWTPPVIAKIGTYFDNIALTKTAIETGAKSAGFIAKSQVCVGGTVTGVGYYEYPATTHDPVLQDGIVLNYGDITLTQAFKTYLLGTTAQAKLVSQFCYKPI